MKTLKSLALGGLMPFGNLSSLQPVRRADGLVVISSWCYGRDANEGAWEVLSENGRAYNLSGT